MRPLLPASLPPTLAVAAPVPLIAGAWTFVIGPHHRTQVTTPPCHLLHLVLSGHYRLGVGHRRYDIHPGDLIYYASQELVTWHHNPAPVRFHSVAFEAPDWRVPDPALRVLSRQAALEPHFARIVAEARAPGEDMPGRVRAHQSLLVILGLVVDHFQRARPQPPALADLWWEVEAHVRATGDLHCPLAAMARLIGRSRNTVHRACLAATGRSPARQLRYLRLELARHLLAYSPQSVTGIAAELGYARLQEFSREFSRHAGMPPSRYRTAAAGPDAG